MHLHSPLLDGDFQSVTGQVLHRERGADVLDHYVARDHDERMLRVVGRREPSAARTKLEATSVAIRHRLQDCIGRKRGHHDRFDRHGGRRRRRSERGSLGRRVRSQVHEGLGASSNDGQRADAD